MICRALALLMLFMIAPALAEDEKEAFESKAPQAILLDARSNRVLYEKDADTPVPPASMSKLMTMIMAYEAIKAGKIKPETEFLISENAWKKGGGPSGGSTMYAELKSNVKVSDLLAAIAVQSANDASIAIAEGLEGSEEEFVRKMELRAKELGFKTAAFRNSTGLPDPDHKMSVRDLAAMARYIVTNFPEQYAAFGQTDFTWNKITQPNRNPLLKDYSGADGLKTGYTKEAGYSLVGSAQRGNRRLIMVIADLETDAARKREAQRLLDWGFSRFKPFSLYAAGEQVGSARVWGGVERRVGLITREPVQVALSAEEQEAAEIKLAYTGPLRAPVKAGEKVGVVRFIVDGNPVAEAPVETAADVAENPSMWKRALDSVLIMVFGG